MNDFDLLVSGAAGLGTVAGTVSAAIVGGSQRTAIIMALVKQSVRSHII